ncbi:kinase-like domain-containing protein [Choanephora cucurbitarum]|nr:kinase-like domain-containing protein [Choanephora cucurbitarum]
MTHSVSDSQTKSLITPESSSSTEIYYSLDRESGTPRKRRASSTSLEEEKSEEEDKDGTRQLTRKMSKLNDHQSPAMYTRGSTVAISRMPASKQSDNNPSKDNALSSSSSSSSSKRHSYKSTPSVAFDLPDWEANPTAWAFLQPLNPLYEPKYLTRRDPDHNGRVGFLIGREQDCDIRVDRPDISKQHCLIYMETGATEKAKGIRIFLEDKSLNGTSVNDMEVGNGKRLLLKHNDELQLIRSSSNQSRNKFFRILFPPRYDATSCEQEYQFGRVLGRGNFATVRHATHRTTRADVAIKVFEKSRFAKRSKMLESIINEVSIMHNMKKHPFVVQMIRTFNEAHRMYLVLEYVPDGELFQYVVDNKSLDENTTRFIFWQLFTAIKYLHLNNIAHRDLKPENVLIANRETLHLKVTDFGLAKSEERNQTFDSQCGTPNYVAPEVLGPNEQRSYDKRCDLWSLGVMLYICLCGFPPFTEDNGPPSMKMQIKTAKYDFPSRYWGKISDEAKDLVRNLLVVNPDERLTIDGALDHDWMYMDNEDMAARQQKLGEEALEVIEKLSVPSGTTLTQAPMQSQELDEYDA